MPLIRVTLNIGLADTPYWTVLRELYEAFESGYVERGKAPDAEPCLVFHTICEDQNIRGAVFGLAARMQEGCIAVEVAQGGEVLWRDLVGPRASKWLPFDPARFVRPSVRITV